MSCRYPRVTIIIPVYNGAAFIQETLRSAIDQNFLDIEIIVCDDGSTDQTASIISTFVDSRINYLYQPNQGVSSARNLGLAKAQGQYVIFLDSDDIIPSDYIYERILLSELFEFDCLTGPVSLFGDSYHGQSRLRGCSHDGIVEILSANPFVATTPSAYFFRRSFLKKRNLYFDHALSSPADRDFLLRCLIDGRVLYSQHLPPLLYRVSSGSMSNRRTESLMHDLMLYLTKLPVLLSYLGLSGSRIDRLSRAIIALDIASVALSIKHYKVFAWYLSLALILDCRLSASKVLKVLTRNLLSLSINPAS